jgi:hypothetical protein
MARANLTAMLGRLEEEPAPPAQPQPTTSQSPPVAPADKSEPRPRSSTRRAAATETAVAMPAGEGPLFRRLDRKETRLRSDQYAALTEHARRLNRAKGTGGERITENTLIRVAIDVLLSRIDELHGATEEELRKSVSL